MLHGMHFLNLFDTPACSTEVVCSFYCQPRNKPFGRIPIKLLHTNDIPDKGSECVMWKTAPRDPNFFGKFSQQDACEHQISLLSCRPEPSACTCIRATHQVISHKYRNCSDYFFKDSFQLPTLWLSVFRRFPAPRKEPTTQCQPQSNRTLASAHCQFALAPSFLRDLCTKSLNKRQLTRTRGGGHYRDIFGHGIYCRMKIIQTAGLDIRWFL